MKLVIEELKLSFFKGVKENNYNFYYNSEVVGDNGAGKTTLADAWLWLMTDKNYGLKSNPNIRPLDVEECTPRVDAVLNVDGKEIRIAKYQECTIKNKDSDSRTICLSNKYEVNGIKCTEKDFKAKLNEVGIDFDLILPLSHIEAFTGRKTADMRKSLELLGGDVSESEIAECVEGVDEVKKLLENYKLIEIDAIYKNKLADLEKTHGKYATKITEQIKGKEDVKTDIDISALELQKNALNEQLEAVRHDLINLTDRYKEFDEIGADVIKLTCELHSLQRTANDENLTKRRAIESKIRENEMLISMNKGTFEKNRYTINSMSDDVKELTLQLEHFRDEYNKANETEFDKMNCVCAYCGQSYPENEKVRFETEFETKKRIQLERITSIGNETKDKIEGLNKMIEKLESDNQSIQKLIDDTDMLLGEFRRELTELPERVDVSSSEEYLKIQSQIAEKEALLSVGDNIVEEKMKLKARQFDIEQELSEVNKKFGMMFVNERIEIQIDELKEKRTQILQEMADCEKIINDVKNISRKKNELLVKEINKHFKLVDFKLFDYQKNGEYKEVCIPQYKGKDLTVHTNTALEMKMKLDIIDGLQKFYNQYYPIFIDEGEKITSTTRKNIHVDSQCIYLTAVEGVKLKIKGGKNE